MPFAAVGIPGKPISTITNPLGEFDFQPRFCSWLQNLPRVLKNTDDTFSIFRVNLDQNAMHFASTTGKFCYCKIWVQSLDMAVDKARFNRMKKHFAYAHSHYFFLGLIL